MMTSRFFFKMLLLRQFLAELNDTLIQCSPIWFVYMVFTDSRFGSYDVTDDVITYNHCRNFGAKYRWRHNVNVQQIGTCLWAIDCAWSRWRHVTGWRHNGDVTFLFFKMLLLRQFLAELNDTLTQCYPIWFVYMVLTDSRFGSYDVTDDVIRYNHCRNFGAKYLGNEAR